MFAGTTLTPEEQSQAQAMAQAVIKRRAAETAAPAYAAAGKALADLAISEARAQGTIWSRFYRDMLGLEAEGRKAFRSAIAAHNKAMSAHVKDASADGETNPQYDGARRSAMVRLSELTTISKALDLGYEMETEWPFHFAVSSARTFLKSQAAGSTRGRKAKPWMDKVKEFLSKNVPEGEWETARELVETLAQIKD